MTEWDATQYDRIAGLQEAMAGEVLDRLSLAGTERILDVGSGSGRITAAVAARVPGGKVTGVDASGEMVAFASRRFAPGAAGNLEFRVADAAGLAFREEFDLVLSFNALHWVHAQTAVLQGILTALEPGGCARLRLVPAGPRPSLEDVIEDTAHGPRWALAFRGVRPPYLHLEPEAYARLAADAGFVVESVERSDHSWNFASTEAFRDFARVTFVEWTRRLSDPERQDFIDAALDAYRAVASANARFEFYQMDVVLRRPAA